VEKNLDEQLGFREGPTQRCKNGREYLNGLRKRVDKHRKSSVGKEEGHKREKKISVV